MVRVLVVDDSVLYRKVLSEVLTDIEGVEVVGVASSSESALAKIEILNPDIVILDIEMPEMDGISILRRIKGSGSAVEIVMVGAHSKEAAPAALKALELGALSFVAKPDVSNPLDGKEFLTSQLVPVIQAIILKRPINRPSSIVKTSIPRPSIKREKFDNVVRSSGVVSPPPGLVKIAAIGISTGGPNALSKVIPFLPANLRVPVVIVQHMPPVFTATLAESLDQKSAVKVVEGQDGMILTAGTVYIAPGGFQMQVVSKRGKVCLQLTDDPPENHCKPAVDFLFRSIAKEYGKRAIGVIMTGMGVDGTLGLKEMKKQGAKVIAQDEKSCVVFGMPNEAINAGVADIVAPLSVLSREIVKMVN